MNIYRLIELEEKIEYLKKTNKTDKEIVDVLKDDFDTKDIFYSLFMPYDEILNEIENYDGSHKKDAVSLVNKLSKEYHYDKDTIIKRIQQVRKINEYKDEDLNKKLFYLKAKKGEIEVENNNDLQDITALYQVQRVLLISATAAASLALASSSILLAAALPVIVIPLNELGRKAVILKNVNKTNRECTEIDKEINSIERLINEREKLKTNQNINTISNSKGKTWNPDLWKPLGIKPLEKQDYVKSSNSTGGFLPYQNPNERYEVSGIMPSSKNKTLELKRK